jgi:hypothetical protein
VLYRKYMLLFVVCLLTLYVLSYWLMHTHVLIDAHCAVLSRLLRKATRAFAVCNLSVCHNWIDADCIVLSCPLRKATAGTCSGFVACNAR